MINKIPFNISIYHWYCVLWGKVTIVTTSSTTVTIVADVKYDNYIFEGWCIMMIIYLKLSKQKCVDNDSKQSNDSPKCL